MVRYEDVVAVEDGAAFVVGLVAGEEDLGEQGRGMAQGPRSTWRRDEEEEGVDLVAYLGG